MSAVALIDELTGEVFPNANLLSNWAERALPSYGANGEELFRDSQGELIEGIYLDMPNDVYHSLPALSSSKLKTFMSSPAHYYREYLSGIERKRTLAQRRTFDAGTHAHTLILEPQGYYKLYFRDVVPADYPDALQTATQIEAQLVALGLKKSGTKAEKVQRLIEANPNIQVFEDIKEKLYAKHGEPQQAVVEGEEITTYGGKIPVDGQVWDDAHRAAKTTRDHAEANAYFQNGLPEVAIIARCPVTGMMLKVKFDWLRHDDTAVDMKTTLSTKPEEFLRQLNNLSYDVQQEFYKYVALLSGIEVSEFTFVATEYLHADICQPYVLSEKRTYSAKKKVDGALRRLNECNKTGRWFGWSEDDCTIVFE